MANSTVVSTIKDRVINALISDKDIVLAIDAKDIEDDVDLVNTHIFRYNKNPDTVNSSITFITLMVTTTSRDSNNSFITPTLEILILSHNDHMNITNIDGIQDNRNDYLSMLIDKKLNGTDTFGGIGVMQMISNTEGTYNSDFLYRRLIFQTIDKQLS